ncbi:alpha/beta hydrolase [Streptomyces sp. NPDC048057]|uniref:alpha/beta hydrolase n=1 Tax=Streptomyces sp. NPDC048057 TaxID=3155628 RepID=UPI0033D46235
MTTSSPFHGHGGGFRGRAAAALPGRRAVISASAAVAGTALLTGGAVPRAKALPPDRPAPPSTPSVVPTLPRPLGPHTVGVVDLHLVDRSRRDPLRFAVPERELMVSVHYPACRVPADRAAAPQMTPAAARSFVELAPVVHPELPGAGVDWAAVTTHAYAGAEPWGRWRPVLLYSPGVREPRTLGTHLAQDLASKGWVVVSIDHPGDASEVDFPGATQHRHTTLVTTELRGDPRQDPDLYRVLLSARVADVRFVLDCLQRLTAGRNVEGVGPPLPKGFHTIFDLGRVAAYGHCAGGTAVSQALYEDSRIRAAVNMEGHLDIPTVPAVPGRSGRPGKPLPVARHGTDRPLDLLATDGYVRRTELERSWAPLLARSGERVRRMRIAGSNHLVFSDYITVAPQLVRAGLMTKGGRDSMVGSVAVDVALPLLKSRLTSFFAEHAPVATQEYRAAPEVAS